MLAHRDRHLYLVDKFRFLFYNLSMAHLMIDIETLGTTPDAHILTIAAQIFDPLQRDWLGQSYYARIDFESQENRRIEQGTLEWWATQKESQTEAFAEDNRIPLDQALTELGRLIWQSKRIWANGSNFDMTILEDAYKSYNMALPWQYFHVRDARTVYSLTPNLNSYPASHHALEDCRRQIDLLWDSLESLKIKELK
jgi:exodeoxyribonuclease VIII